MKLNLNILLLMACVSCSSSKKNMEAQVETREKQPAVEINTAGGAEEVVNAVQRPVEAPTSQPLWEQKPPTALPSGEKRIEPNTYSAYACAYDQLTAALDAGATTISLPTTSGMVSFNIQNSNTMSESLAAKFPNIRSYKGESEDGSLRLRLDTNDDGFFAEVSGTNRKELIAPLFKGDSRHYAVYKEEDLDGGTPRDGSYE